MTDPFGRRKREEDSLTQAWCEMEEVVLEGFFHMSELTQMKQSPSLVPRCAACKLLDGCKTPKMVPYGEGERNVLVVGEAPGKSEDLRGRPFVGKTGQKLRDTLHRIGIDLDADCTTTNSLICRPPGNATPTSKQISYCRPNLLRLIQELKPSTIILLGAPAVESVIGWLFRPDPGGMFRWAGWRIPCQRWNCWICPTFHPSHVVHQEEERDKVTSVVFEHHLKQAFKLRGRPYEEVPDYKKQVTASLNTDKAAAGIDLIRKSGYPFAWDLETDSIKPDRKDVDIISCAISNGETTVAYPWSGDAVRATIELLKSDVPKIGFNAKFETRWIRSKHGFTVRNWIWDGMLAAHALDNRPGICGLEFQAFARLGQEPWDSVVASFMTSNAKEGANSKNRLRECSLRPLLTYNGLDALLEFHVAQHQMKEMGVKL